MDVFRRFFLFITQNKKKTSLCQTTEQEETRSPTTVKYKFSPGIALSTYVLMLNQKLKYLFL